MNAERFRRIDEIFNHVRSMEPDDRSIYLAAACGDDGELRAEVEALLNHDDQPRNFLKTPAIQAGLQFSSAGGAFGPTAPAADLPLPEMIGGYQIERVIGEGGFGIVYLAIQEKPRRTVALKVIRANLATPQMLRRFEFEAQVLGRLTHPGIAQVYEAGTDKSGGGVRAFFAMEYIRGKRLDQFANDNNLDHNGRLELVAKVCDAVQYAHQKGVIHRDLKPPNILVDESGHPKILDFGVSRATDPDIYTTTLQTSAGQLIGTLPYMSPEQVSGDPGEVDTRSDVYALGVILYQLLTGKLPHNLDSRSIPEAARVIRDEQPTRLSSFSRAFRGDVDTIVLKAMEKDKLHRYQTAADLAADIRRSLAGEPIEAKRSSGWYVLQKTLRRYRLATAISAVFIIMLITGSIALGVLYNRAEEQSQIARRERDAARTAQATAEFEAERARQEAARANTIKNFILRLFQAADPRTARGTDRTVREVLDSVDRWLDTTLETEPLVEATIRETIGQTYLSMGQLSSAENNITKALEIREKIQPGSVELAEARLVFAALLAQKGDFAGSEKIFTESLAVFRQSLPPNDSRIGSALMNLGSLRIELGQLDGVESILLEAVEIARNAPPLKGPQEHEDSELAAALSSLGKIYNAQGNPAKAEQFFREGIEVCLKKLGDDHPLLAPLYNNMAAVMDNQDRTEEALPFFLKSLDLARKTLGERHVDIAHPLCGVGQAYARLKKFEEAESYFREALAIRTEFLAPGHPLFGQVLTGLGRTLIGQNKLAEAEPILREALRVRDATTAPGDYNRGFTRCVLGECLLRLDQFAEAESMLLEAYETIAQSRGPGYSTARSTAELLAELYSRQNAPEKSKEWLAKAERNPA